MNSIWGLGIGDGDWGLGIGPNPQSPIPNPQSPIPNIKNNNNHLAIIYTTLYDECLNILELLIKFCT
jgi:hypothetical protein